MTSSAALVRTFPQPYMSPQIEAVFAAVRADAHLGREVVDKKHWETLDAIFDETYSWKLAGSPHLAARLVYIYMYLDHDQLSALMAGTPFAFGVGTFRSCVYSSTGQAIHLQPDSDTEGAVRCQTFRKRERWNTRPLCGAAGLCLAAFDDAMFTQLAESYTHFGSRYEAGRTLTSEQMLAKVCCSCVQTAGERYTGICPHGSTHSFCGVCYQLEQLRVNNVVAEAVADINALLAAAPTGTPPKAAELRTHPNFGALCDRIVHAFDQGAPCSQLASALGWHGSTVATLRNTKR